MWVGLCLCFTEATNSGWMGAYFVGCLVGGSFVPVCHNLPLGFALVVGCYRVFEVIPGMMRGT